MTFLEILFWAGLAVLGYTYIGYGLLIGFISLTKRMIQGIKAPKISHISPSYQTNKQGSPKIPQIFIQSASAHEN